MVDGGVAGGRVRDPARRVLRPQLDLGQLLIGFPLGLVAKVALFVLAQIVVRLFRGSKPSAVAIATAPVTTVISGGLLLLVF